MSNEIKITGREANVLLYAFDDFFVVDENGKVLITHRTTFVGVPRDELQALRDKLFAVHEHGEEDAL